MNRGMEDRLRRLERSNYRWRTCGMGLMVAIGAWVLVAAEKTAPPAEIIQAKRIELIGADGKADIILEAKPEANSLTVWGPDHEHAAVLVSQAHKSAMMLMKDPQAVEVSAEAADPGGQIAVTDGKSAADGARSSISLTASANGFSLFHLFNGRPASQLSFSKLGGGLELRTPGSKAATRVLGSDRGGHVEILNADGQAIWSAPSAR